MSTDTSRISDIRIRHARRTGGRVLVHVLLVVVGAIFIGPFVWMLLTTVKTLPEILSYPPTFLPRTFIISNYAHVFQDLPVLHLFANSLIVSVIPLFTNVLFGSLAGFILAKIPIRGRTFIFGMILLCMSVPLESRVVPMYLLFARALHGNDAYWAALFPVIMGPFSIFLMRQYILEIPNELMDAAVMDGSTFRRTYASIVLPLVRPAAATVAIVAFMWNWRALLWPLLVFSDPQRRTLEMGLATYSVALGGTAGIDFGRYMAFATIGIVPVLVVFLILQRQFISSLALSGVKG